RHTACRKKGFRPLFLWRYEPVNGPAPASLDHQGDGDGYDQEVIFKTLPLLLPEPVHEKTVLEMDHRYSHGHITEDAECRDPREKSRNQPEGSGRFRKNGKECEERGNAHLGCEDVHGPDEAGAAEPAEGLLCPVGEKDNPQQQPEHKGCTIIIG